MAGEVRERILEQFGGAEWNGDAGGATPIEV